MADANIANGTSAKPLTRRRASAAKSVATLRKTITSQAYGAVKRAAQAADSYSKFHERMTFDDRRVNAKVLVAILAGYKQDLWPMVMPRLKAAIGAMEDVDVCFVSPGKRDQNLAELCQTEHWSYLATSTNDVSLAQNVCFKIYDQAELIVKLDEDMFLLPDTITTLVQEYQRIKANGKVDPGFVAPMIPLNGFCYRPLLSSLGLLDEFEARFGKARLATSGLPIHTDPLAARWMWEKTSPLSELPQRLDRADCDDLLSPIQFSIGIIVFERSFWESFGYFMVHRRKLMAGMNTLGGDEKHICAAAMLHSRPIVVTTNAVAGHFSFGGQYAGMVDLMESRPELFA